MKLSQRQLDMVESAGAYAVIGLLLAFLGVPVLMLLFEMGRAAVRLGVDPGFWKIWSLAIVAGAAIGGLVGGIIAFLMEEQTRD